MTRIDVRSFTLGAVLFAVSGLAGRGQAAPIFSEEFTANDSSWKNTANAAPNYNATGGNDGGGYISSNFMASGTGTVAGAVIFRGQDDFSSSGNAFVRNWIADGVGYFSIAMQHSASVPLSFNLRFSTPNNSPGASTANFTLPVSSDWQTITIPIIDSVSPTPGAVFQTYGGPTGSYNAIFSNIGHVQVSLVAPTGLAPAETFSIGIDSVSIEPVPEPGSIALGCLGVVGAGLLYCRRLKKPVV